MLVTSLARDLYDSVAADRDPDPGAHYIRRRWLVGVFLVQPRPRIALAPIAPIGKNGPQQERDSQT